MAFDMTVGEIMAQGKRGDVLACVASGYAAWHFIYKDQECMAVVDEEKHKLVAVLKKPELSLIYTSRILHLAKKKEE